MQNLLMNKLILPELVLASLIPGIIILDLICLKNKKIIYCLVQTVLLFVMYRILLNFNKVGNYIHQEQSNFFTNGFILNFEGNFLKLILVTLVFMFFVYIKTYVYTVNNSVKYFALSLLSLLGGMVLISSNDFFNFYFGIEMATIPIYGLISLNNHPRSSETALNFFILNFIFSGLLLYGLSLIYGATGDLGFVKIINFVTTQHISILFYVGIVLLLVGILFKLYMVPFQNWVPDLYENSSIIAIILLFTLPSIALVGKYGYLLKNVLINCFKFKHQLLLMVLAILSILVGNIGAITQTNIKRILGYSLIAHSGFMLLGLFTNNSEGIFAANFYIVVHSFMLISFWGAILLLQEHKIILKDLKDFAGLAKIHPMISAILLILLLSMSGVPPTVGFYSKFLILKALISENLIIVAIAAGLISLLSVYYCFKIMHIMYFIDYNNLNDLNTKSYSYSMPKSWSTLQVLAKSHGPVLIILLFNIIWVLIGWLLPICKI